MTTSTIVTRPDLQNFTPLVISTIPNHEETGLEAIPSEKKFRLNSRRVFLTFPQCDLPPETALARIKESDKTKSTAAIVAQEKHKDGHMHLHVYIESPRPFNIRNPSYFDFIGGKRGNYQKVKYRDACIRYVCKENSYVAHEIDVPSVIQKYESRKGSKRSGTGTSDVGPSKRIYQELRAGKSYSDLLKIEDIGGYLVLHSSNVKAIANDFQLERIKELRNQTKPAYLHLIICGREFDLLAEMPFKTPQFWLHGVANVGKTTLIRKLEEAGMQGFQIPANNDFANWDDEAYDFAYIDEFKGQLTIQFLNEFLQGSRMNLPGKYVVGGRIKKKNLPIFILSNMTPDEVFKKKTFVELQPLLSRLHVIEIKSFFDYTIMTEPLRDTNGSPLYLNELYCDEDMPLSN